MTSDPWLDFETQPVCSHCLAKFPEDLVRGCAASEWQSTGKCLGIEGDCTCYGTEVDGGLCEGCYLLTK